MKIYNIYRGFTEYGGAESVVLSIHNNLKARRYASYIAGPDAFPALHPDYRIQKEDYLRLSPQSVGQLKDAVVFSHHRKMTTYLRLVQKITGLRFRLIHVSHNEFHNLKPFTLFPREVIAVSGRVKENLVNYFGVAPERVKVIYNGLADGGDGSAPGRPAAAGAAPGTINILYPGRVTRVKRQLEVFEQLAGNLKPGVQIHFAGTGNQLEELKAATKDAGNFKTLGFVPIRETLPAYDYVLLFSTNEGLPLTLIEGCMFGKPIICNDVGGNLEILQDGFNGMAANSFSALARVLNSLPLPATDAYRQLSRNARSVFEQKFRQERMIGDYIDVIERRQ
jgi:glycosyltransferase involved in cell wall biosynthesis